MTADATVLIVGGAAAGVIVGALAVLILTLRRRGNGH